MGYFLDNWGSFASLTGILISAAGLWAAVVAMGRAGKAKESAEAAELAALQTRKAITAELAVIELQRAIALIQRIKDLIQDNRWEVTQAHYQPLRTMLSDLSERFPPVDSDDLQMLHAAIFNVTVIDNTVARKLTGSENLLEEADVREVLNGIQSNLERVASRTYFGGRGE